MEIIMSALTSAAGALGALWDSAIDNPLALFFIGASAFTVGAGMFSTLKNSAR